MQGHLASTSQVIIQTEYTVPINAFFMSPLLQHTIKYSCVQSKRTIFSASALFTLFQVCYFPVVSRRDAPGHFAEVIGERLEQRNAFVYM